MSADKVIFLGGLPRAGSTLLANVLAQNPRFEVTPTSPLCEYVMGMAQAFTNSPQRRAWLNQDRARSAFRSAVRGAIHGHFSAPVGVDKSRGWTGQCDLLTRVFGAGLKMIVPVRDLRGCVMSQENKYRQNPEFAWDGPMLDLDGRVGHFLNSAPLGPAATQIKEALRTRHAEAMCFVRMEDFCADPERELGRIYAYMDEDRHAHDLTDIPTRPQEHDGVHAPIGDHTLTDSRVRPVNENWKNVLGAELSERIVRENAWFYQTFYPERITCSG